jgi:hypothetical protein
MENLKTLFKNVHNQIAQTDDLSVLNLLVDVVLLVK